MKIWHIFDLDGTLVDSMPYFRRGILQVLDDDGIPYGPDMADILTPLGYTKSAQLYQTMGVVGTVEEIVPMIQFLADVEKTRFIVGQVICVDGGQSCDGSIESMNFPLSFAE